MFTRTACGLAAWVGLAGVAAAQVPGLTPDDRPPLYPGVPSTARTPGEPAPRVTPYASPTTLPPAATAVPSQYTLKATTRPTSATTAPGQSPLPATKPTQLPPPTAAVEPTPPEPASRVARLTRPIAAYTQDEAPAPRPTTKPGAAPVAGSPVNPGTPVIPPAAQACGLTGSDLGYENCASCCGCVPCGPPGCAWANFEWLYWTTSGQYLPPLVTGGTPTNPGVLGAPGTTVLYGDQRANNGFRNGFRVSGGFWLNECHTFGLEADFFFLGNSNTGFAAGSNGSQVIGRPFVNALTNMQDAQLVSFPNVLAGTVTVGASNSVIGGGINAVHNLCCDPCGRLDLIYGYRYFNLTDEVTIQEDLTSLGGGSRVPPGYRILVTDKFRTVNNFNGGVIGVAGEQRRGMFFLGYRASIAFGANQQTTEIDGYTTIIPPGGPATTYPGGLYAQPSNIGRYTRTVFAVMPEIGLRLGVQATEHCRVYVGYNFLYLSNVLRAGDQIDQRVNPNQLPPRTNFTGPALPAYTPKSTDFWMQGVSIGLEVRF